MYNKVLVIKKGQNIRDLLQKKGTNHEVQTNKEFYKVNKARLALM